VNTLFALGAARQALEDADLLESAHGDRSRMGVYLGSGEGSDEFPGLVRGLAGASLKDGSGRVNPGEFVRLMLGYMDGAREREQEMYTPAGHVAQAFALEGPNLACQTACAASSQAIGEALDIIRQGEADVMMAGGSHSMIHPLGISGFNRLTALSQRNESPRTASRPFDLTRDGFVIGEGAGLIILEELEHARNRGAHIYAELTGYGTTADAFRMTDPHPEGRGAIRAMADAIADAGLKPSDIGYINAHGTSTQANDATETAAIKAVFGEAAHKVPISSSKSMLGHLIAAAGVVELVISIMALRQGVIPPTINYQTPDPACDLDYVPNTAREMRFRHVLSNSFGFGGQNISLVASRFVD
jgi:3-oxoacyl-[acyl-carrier-protein] synthase II